MEDLPLDQEGLRVGDIMNPKIYSVTEDATVSEVASLMLKGHLHRLLVTREDRAVGILTTSDLLGLLVGEDIAGHRGHREEGREFFLRGGEF